MRTKSHSFLQNVLSNDFDVICITESWLNDNFHNSEYFDDRYELFRCDRDAAVSGHERGGGAMIAVRRSLCPWHRTDMRAPPPADEVWVSLQLRASSERLAARSQHSIHIICTYIVQGTTHESLLTSFYDRIIEFISDHPDDLFIILGDFNVRFGVWSFNIENNSMELQASTDKLVCHTADFMNMSLLSQYNNQFNVNNRLLDLVFSNKSCQVSSCSSPLVPEDVHHKSLELIMSVNVVNSLKLPIIKKKQFHKADYTSIKHVLKSINWQDIFRSMNDVESKVSYFYSIIDDIISRYVPSYNLNTKNKYPPWYTAPLIKLSKEKNKFHKRWKQYGNSRDYQTFSLLRKRFKKLSVFCHNKFISFSEENIKADPKLFWSFVKSKNTCGDIPARMTYEGKLLSDGNEICDAFNRYFHSVFVPTQNTDSLLDYDESKSTLNISSVNITLARVLDELKKLNLNKGSGSDNLPPIFIRECANELALPITLIFQTSIDTGVFPNKWKQSLVTPIPKNSKKSFVTEYRPISKLCVLGKILEKIVTADISTAAKNVISVNQHGFFKKRSVDTNMLIFTDFLAESLDNNSQVDVVYTDFSKAFDKINHDMLISKLLNAGVHGNLLRWINSYIRNRSQSVRLKGFSSQFLPVPSGVPQGSHLGPLLFSLYINDIGYAFNHSHHLLYADDTKLFKVVNSIDDCKKLQLDLISLQSYCTANQLFLNIDKCNVITYTRKKKPIHFDYSLNNNTLKRVSSIRDLGIIMDSELSFNLHIDHIIGFAFRRLGFVLRITKPFKNTTTLKILYFSFVRSILDFCSTVWNPSYKVHINRIEKIQQKFIKALNYRKNFSSESYDISLKRHNLQTLSNRRKMFDLLYLHKILHSMVDSSELLAKLKFSCPIRLPVRPSRILPTFAPPRYKKNYTRNSFFYRSTNIYNHEFSDIDLLNISHSRLKQKLKTTLCISS